MRTNHFEIARVCKDRYIPSIGQDESNIREYSMVTVKVVCDQSCRCKRFVAKNPRYKNYFPD